MSYSLALGTGTTHAWGLARVAAFGLITDGGVGALIVTDTVSGITAPSHNRISYLAFGAQTCVATKGVATQGRAVARGVTALVYVNTSSSSVCLEATFAIAHSCVIHRLTTAKSAVHTVAGV